MLLSSEIKSTKKTIFISALPLTFDTFAWNCRRVKNYLVVAKEFKKNDYRSTYYYYSLVEAFWN